MALRKAMAASVFTGCLLAQTLVMTPPWGPASERYWPFLEYPMYSRSHRVGDATHVRELRAISCDRAATVVVTPFDLSMSKFVLWDLLDSVDGADHWHTEAERAQAKALLERLVVDRMAPRFCRAEIWQKRWVIGERGPVEPDPPWTLVYAWPIARGPATLETTGSDAPRQ